MPTQNEIDTDTEALIEQLSRLLNRIRERVKKEERAIQQFTYERSDMRKEESKWES